MIGIVILNYKTPEETVDCIKSIESHTSLQCKIYVVDNCSQDDSLSFIKNSLSNLTVEIEYIPLQQNNGYSAGNNAGIKKAVSDGCGVVFIVNSDVILLNDALTMMYHTLLSDPEYAAVGPSVSDLNQNETQMLKMPLSWSKFLYGRHPLVLIPFFRKKSIREYAINDQEALDHVQSFNGMVSGCCFGMRAEDFKCLDYLDENVFLYYEEDIIAYKLQAIKKKAVVDFNAKILHKGGVSTAKKGTAFTSFHRWVSVFYLLKKYGGITKGKQYFVYCSNTFTFRVQSLLHASYKELLPAFIKKNKMILKMQ